MPNNFLNRKQREFFERICHSENGLSLEDLAHEANITVKGMEERVHRIRDRAGGPIIFTKGGRVFDALRHEGKMRSEGE